MIGILCKHWQVTPEEFGRLFNVAEPERYINGELTLPHHTYERFSRVMQAASKMEAEGTVAYELQAFQEEHGLNVPDLSDGIGVSKDGIRAWLRLDSKPNRNSILRVAAFLNRSPLEEEWAYQFGCLRTHMHAFGIRQKWLAEVMGISQLSVSNYFSGRNKPRKVFMETWLPWVSGMNDAFVPLINALGKAPNRD